MRGRRTGMARRLGGRGAQVRPGTRRRGRQHAASGCTYGTAACLAWRASTAEARPLRARPRPLPLAGRGQGLFGASAAGDSGDLGGLDDELGLGDLLLSLSKLAGESQRPNARK